MLVLRTVSWVRDFVDVTASAEEIADTLALRGFEVASVEPLAGDDAVIDFEVTANRPDCLSVIGFAREVATAYDLPLRLPSTRPTRARAAPRRVGRLGSPPRHDRGRRAVPALRGAVADVTRRPLARVDDDAAAGGRRAADQHRSSTSPTTCCIELGQPMHAFDLAKLAGARDPRPARQAGETHHDARRRRADARRRTCWSSPTRDRAQAVAGVMGGAASEVSGDDQSGRVRERVLQAGVGPPDEQAARPEDRSVVAIRARRRHQRRRSSRCSARSR